MYVAIAGLYTMSCAVPSLVLSKNRLGDQDLKQSTALHPSYRAAEK